MPLPLPALSSLVSAVASNQDDDKKSAPAYLYCKRKIYYFRYAFPANLRKSLGRAELRVSLQTSYVRIARFRARMLSAEIGNMILEGFMLDYKEIRRRMNILLQRLLEQDHADLSERKNISVGKLNITYDQLRTSQIELLLHCNSPQLLEQIAPECIVDLLRWQQSDMLDKLPCASGSGSHHSNYVCPTKTPRKTNESSANHCAKATQTIKTLSIGLQKSPTILPRILSDRGIPPIRLKQ
ncbi:DUF6538 domain-containing protein [uncultured Desulfovibrio sp.]|uniref:DUF6538 domain-containing protein n=1 Tax=uncultured Desulfovibrio sp. TaxID=167968 RepID=UPI0028687F9F|nr:DUF6538 domain-containing protein [uncultured Desulfovibrio sp.]